MAVLFRPATGANTALALGQLALVVVVCGGIMYNNIFSVY